MSNPTESTGREQWLAERRKGLGSSDAAAVLGLNPFKSALTVWLEKLHPDMLPEPENRELLDFGNDVEPAIARAYERATGRAVTMPNGLPFVHPEFPELMASPDRMVANFSVEKRLVELKWESKFSDKFGAPGSDEVPDAYLIQAAHQMAVLGCDWCDIASMHAGPPVLIYPLHRDKELEKEIIQRERHWWATYIVADQEPPITGDPAWAKYLAQKYPSNRGEIVKVTNEEVEREVHELIAIRRNMKTIEARESELESIIKNYIADRDGITGEWGTITWRKGKDQEAYTVPARPGSRRFLVKETK